MDAVSNIPDVLLALAAYLVITISPGPANIAVMSASMKDGKQHGLALGAGIVSGSVCWGIVAAAGLSAFLSSNDRAYDIVKILGGLYLFWMAYTAFRSAFSNDISKALTPPTRDRNTQPKFLGLYLRSLKRTRASLGKIYLRGFIIHITNPKAVFAWTAVMSLGLKQGISVSLFAFILIICGCMLQGTVVSLYALIFSTKQMMRFYNKFSQRIESVLGVVFGAAGAKMFLSVRES